MGNLGVVVGQPLLGLLAYLGEMAEDVHIEHAAPEFWSRALQAADIDVMKGLDVERWLCGLLKLRGYTPATTASDNTVRGTVCNRHGKAGPPGYQ